MKNYIDLHIHSKYSDDGEYTPAQLVEMCEEKGIRIMALADHNTAEGVLKAKKKSRRTWLDPYGNKQSHGLASQYAEPT